MTGPVRPVRRGPAARTPNLSYPDDLSPLWHPELPEFACAANAVSLMMPHVEPYVVRAVRLALPALEGPLAGEARAYVAQEAQHHAQHRRFNDLVAARIRGVRTLDRAMAATYGWLWRRRSARFHLAHAASAEALAYALARWSDRHDELFRRADPTVARLYLWHLAEEVEHKNVAHDVYDARHRGRWPLAGAVVVALSLMAAFVVAGTTLGLLHARRLHRPVAWWRLTRWSLGFLFSEIPNVLISVLPGHHPSDFADPSAFAIHLAAMDAAADAAGLLDSRGPGRDVGA